MRTRDDEEQTCREYAGWLST